MINILLRKVEKLQLDKVSNKTTYKGFFCKKGKVLKYLFEEGRVVGYWWEEPKKTITLCTIEVLNKSFNFMLPFIKLKNMDYIFGIDFKNYRIFRKLYQSYDKKGFIFSIFYYKPLFRDI